MILKNNNQHYMISLDFQSPVLSDRLLMQKEQYHQHENIMARHLKRNTYKPINYF